MNLTQTNLRILGRSEGKIKSYESCCDVRAWSHDVKAKDRHLKEWMKSDMPICVIPTRILTSLLKAMTCSSQRRATPRCHRDCKTRMLIEYICTSCRAVKECLKQDKTLETFFIEEELETSHWPCDRCLEALKSIKMFWKIIIDKIFNLNTSKYDELIPKCEPTDSIKSVAKVWEAEMIKQTLFVKNNARTSKRSNNCRYRNPVIKTNEGSIRKIKSEPINRADDSKNRNKSKSFTKSESNISFKKSSKNLTKSTSARINMADVGCEPCFAVEENEKIRVHKRQIGILQDRNHYQREEINRLKKENHSLKIELQNVYRSPPWKPSLFSLDRKDIVINHHKPKTIPEPFEANVDEDNYSTKHIESEMIITMKNCKNKSYKHVSLLQVLHKTNNGPVEDLDKSDNDTADPINLLTKVQNTFGAMVKREVSIVNNRKYRPDKTDVDPSFHQINISRSAPSCFSVSSGLNSEREFVSSKDFNEKYVTVSDT